MAPRTREKHHVLNTPSSTTPASTKSTDDESVNTIRCASKKNWKFLKGKLITWYNPILN